ncbi:hypothetical protein JCM24511_06097 [Saitozyma sp. JCM 24511]|nr:hypothetical protein JCM24511_06097 [Saitozyma sp. JCM 24511]
MTAAEHGEHTFLNATPMPCSSEEARNRNISHLCLAVLEHAGFRDRESSPADSALDILSLAAGAVC